jgi:hypothetical protein
MLIVPADAAAVDGQFCCSSVAPRGVSTIDAIGALHQLFEVVGVVDDSCAVGRLVDLAARGSISVRWWSRGALNRFMRATRFGIRGIARQIRFQLCVT